MLLGSHVSPEDPIGTAEQEGADCVQIFLGNPQSWKKPKPRDDAAELKKAPIPIFVHAPYLINVASPNNRVRIPSRKILQQTCDAAAEIGAAGGDRARRSRTEDDDRRRRVRPLAQGHGAASRPTCPCYLENTAGGDHAMARHFDTIGRLWDHIGDTGIGFCLDTCHAHAAGEDLHLAVERITAITGRIDLVHCNDSKDEAGSGRDRHENLGHGQIPTPICSVDIVRAADAPVICETAEEGRKDDLALLRTGLGLS